MRGGGVGTLLVILVLIDGDCGLWIVWGWDMKHDSVGFFVWRWNGRDVTEASNIFLVSVRNVICFYYA